MKHTFMTIIGLLSLLLTSCFEQSTVIKVNKDGTGIIHTRSYQNTGAVGGLGAMFGGGGEEAADSAAPDLPSDEELQSIAQEMGEGVSVQSVKQSTNKAGWPGHEAIYAFTDISKVKIPLDTQMDQTGIDTEEVPAEASNITFGQQGDVLSIFVPFISKADEEVAATAPAEASENPFGDTAAGGLDSMMSMMGMMGPMFKGARMGVFVQIDGELVATNAKHSKGQLITILNADIGKLLSDPKALTDLKGIEAPTREEAQAIADKLDGITADFTEEIKVKIR